MIKKITLLFISILFLASCGSARKAENNVASGDYDEAIQIAVTKLTEDKNKKSNQKLIPTLKDAYTKANKRDLQRIAILKKQNNPEGLKEIYSLYMGLDVRQDDVMYLQPLYYDNKEVKFTINDYTNDVKKAKNNYSKQLYDAGIKQLAGTKINARSAFKSFNDLEFINPTYVSNITDLVAQAKEKGSSHVLLKLQNHIQQATTSEQLDELMRISESNMNNKWVMYHKLSDGSTVNSYDYEVTVNLDQIQITPEEVNTENVQQQRKVKDGWELVYDTNGHVMKDSLGNDVKRDKIITVQAQVKLFQQLKSAKIDGAVAVKNVKANSQMNNTPVFGEAKFENVYALYQGDQRAIDQKYYEALKKKEVPFPTDPEFVKYSLADFRNKLLQILDAQPF